MVCVDLQKQSMKAARNTGPRVSMNPNTKTDANGKFSLTRVPPGDATICRREYIPFPGQPNAFTSRDTLQQSITISAGETTTVNVGGDPNATDGK
jgi:hypothetical protein